MSWHPLVSPVWSTVASTMDCSSTLPGTVVAADAEVGRDAPTLLLASSAPVRQVHCCEPTLQRHPWKFCILDPSEDEDDDGLLSISPVDHLNGNPWGLFTSLSEILSD